MHVPQHAKATVLQEGGKEKFHQKTKRVHLARISVISSWLYICDYRCNLAVQISRLFVCVHVPTFIFQQEEKGTNSHFLLSRQVTYIPLPPKFGLKWWPTKCWIWLTTIFSSFLGSLSIQKTNVSLCTIRSVKLNFVDFVNESWKSV